MKKAKKINSQKTNFMISTDNEMTKLIILILIVAVIFSIFYVVTLFVTKEDNNNETNDNNNSITETNIDYSKILAGNILSQKDSEYYALICFKDDMYVDSYKSYLQYYKDKIEGAVPFYFVDINNTLNSRFISDNSNLSVTDAKDFKFSQTTLLRIRDGKVISSYEGNDNIAGKLGRMTK